MSKKNILTPHQHRLIKYKLTDGLTFSEIALRCHSSVKAVHWQFGNIYDKLNIEDSSQLYFGYRRYISSESILIELGIPPVRLNLNPGPISQDIIDELVEYIRAKQEKSA